MKNVPVYWDDVSVSQQRIWFWIISRHSVVTQEILLYQRPLLGMAKRWSTPNRRTTE
jgi:hypothetical protein